MALLQLRECGPRRDGPHTLDGAIGAGTSQALLKLGGYGLALPDEAAGRAAEVDGDVERLLGG